MGRARSAAFVVVAAAGGLIAFAASHCASPTQIIVSVHADPQLCSGVSTKSGALRIHNTGITVSTPERVEDDDFDRVDTACDAEDGTIGDLTITPRDSDDAVVAIRVVSAINGKDAQDCKSNNLENCIIQRRTERFLANQTVQIDVYMSARCVNVDCKDLECDPNTGKCVDAIQKDGAVAPQKDGGGTTKDAGTDASKEDPCNVCRALGGETCDPFTKLCSITCAGQGCSDKTFGGIDFTFDILCSGAGACFRTKCEGPNTVCKFTCGAGGGATAVCADLSCAAKECSIDCSSIENNCQKIDMDSGTNTITCQAPNTPAVTGPSCDNVSCTSKSCARTCAGPPLSGAGCGPGSSCDGGCANWAVRDAGL